MARRRERAPSPARPARTWLQRGAALLFFLTAGSLFVWSLGACVLSCIGLPIRADALLRPVLLVMAGLGIVFVHRYTRIAAACLAVLAGLVLAVDLLRSPDSPEYQAAGRQLQAVLEYLGGEGAISLWTQRILVWGIVGLLGLLAAFFMLLTYRFPVLLAVSGVIAGLCLASGFLTNATALAAYLLSLLLLLVRQLYLSARMPHRGGLFFPCAVPCVLLSFLVALQIPTPGEEVTADSVAELVARPFRAVNDALYESSAPRFFSLENTGYRSAATSRLGGDILLGDNIVLEVASDRPLYLAGSYKDVYTGHSWENSTPQGEDATIGDPGESVEFLERIGSNFMLSLINGEFQQYAYALANPQAVWTVEQPMPPGTVFSIVMTYRAYPEREIEVFVRDPRTLSVFTPPMATGILADGVPMKLRRNGSGDLAAGELLRDGDSYTVIYRDNAQISYWSIILAASRRGVLREIREELTALHAAYEFDPDQVVFHLGDGEAENTTALHLFRLTPPGEPITDPSRELAYEEYLAETLIPRADAIYQRYTKLPEGLPARVRELAERITENAGSDYLKLYRLEAFLRSFPYTWTPGDTPEGRDFADHFLFDLQEGYCAHYATAFVVMARSLGLPARYVEGYATTREQNGEDRFIVTDRQAHAWPEVYLEGYGWMAFEPTPSEGGEAPPSSYPEIREWMEGQRAAPPPEASSQPTGPTAATAGGGTAPTAESRAPARPAARLLQNILLVAAVLALWPLGRAAAEHLSRARLRAARGNRAAVLAFRKAERLLRRLGLPMDSSETALAYAERVGQALSGAPSLEVGAALYTAACFRREALSEAERAQALRALEDTRRLVRERLGWPRYLVKLYLL